MSKTFKKSSLQRQFVFSLFLVLLLVVVAAGMIQLYSINKEVTVNMYDQGTIMAKSIDQGIQATDEASKGIEHQIDLKLVSYSERIADQLQETDFNQITNSELAALKDKFHIAGITLLARQKDDIVGVRATDDKEIGFSFKKIGYEDGYKALDSLFNGKRTGLPMSYEGDNYFVLPITQSGSHDKPVFFKYSYLYLKERNYIICPYIEANEVYQYTTKVGPDSWIKKVKEQNPYVIEVAVLNPKVFKDPTLETKLFPPMKKVEHGVYNLQDSRDRAILKNMVEKPEQGAYVGSYKGTKVYKMFLPINENNVIYIAFDYNKVSKPLFEHSLILIFVGLIALVALFLIATKFFNRIYENIQKIKKQIKSLENKDFTAKSDVKDKNELSDLSESTNKMAETLNDVLQETSDHVSNVQRLSVILEQNANESVDKLYAVSIETTMNQRDKTEEISDFLDDVEGTIQSQGLDTVQAEKIQDKIERMRELAKERSSTTTDMTIMLSDLIKDLHGKSKELTISSNRLLEKVQKFKLS